MISTYLRRGVTAGAIAGGAMALVLVVLGEGPIGAAIAVEEASGHAGDTVFTRPQQVVGGIVGLVLAGVATGAIFGVVFAATRHRMAGDDWRRSVTLAAAGFTALSLVPFLKYPPNPPAVGDPATVGRRTALYLGLVAWSLIVTWGTWRLHRTLAATTPALGRATRVRAAAPRRVVAVTAAFVAAVTVAFVAFPGPPDPVTLPADLVWRFRLASLAGAACFWAVLGMAHGWLSSDRDAAVATVVGSGKRQKATVAAAHSAGSSQSRRPRGMSAT